MRMIGSIVKGEAIMKARPNDERTKWMLDANQRELHGSTSDGGMPRFEAIPEEATSEQAGCDTFKQESMDLLLKQGGQEYPRNTAARSRGPRRIRKGRGLQHVHVRQGERQPRSTQACEKGS